MELIELIELIELVQLIQLIHLFPNGGDSPDPTPPARFGQILPGGCPAKFGQIEPRLSGGPKLFKLSRLDLAKFCRAASGQNLAKSSHAFLIAYEGQPDLAKFCPEAARQNLAKSSRDSLKISGLQKGAARFGQILPGGCPAKFGQIEPRISHRVDEPIWPNFARRLPGKIWPNRAAPFWRPEII